MNKQEEFIRVVKENEGLIYKITSIYSDNNEDQKDLYQEIVYQLWKSFDSFKGASKISTWTYRIALNTSITFLNKKKRSVNQVQINFDLMNISNENDTLKEDRLTALYAQIKRLNVIEKGLILLFLEGKKHEEIAAIMGFTKTNVGTRLGRIKEKLKSQTNG